VSAQSAVPAAPHAATLERRLGPLDSAAIVVSNVIGSGIFFVPILVAGMVPTSPAILGVWLLGGLLAFAGAMAYAELAAIRPRAGGEYVYLRDAFGPVAAFLTGWTSSAPEPSPPTPSRSPDTSAGSFRCGGRRRS
jgi:APA family basic amino acid/polyamine antiporter